MQKVGMIHEGSFRKYVRKWSEFADFGILREDWALTAGGDGERG
jgi:hypothetical protein